MTKLEICNLSLDRLAIEPITELDFTGSVTGRLCSRTFDNILKSMLYSYDWGFSISEITASTNPTSSQILSTYNGKKSSVSLNATGFDCIRILACDEDYVVESGVISFNGSGDIDITYIKDITDTAILSVGFVQVLIVHLAYILAGKLTQSDGAVDELMSEYKMLESRAMVLNQRERNNTLVIKRT
jgi:hypothetical protein